MDEKMISFEMNIRLIPSPRPRVMKGVTFMPKKYTEQKKLIQSRIRAFKSFGDAPLKCWISIGLKRSATEKRNKLPMPTGDVDNYAKTILDACEGYLFNNDRQITELRVKKGYFESDFVNVVFERI